MVDDCLLSELCQVSQPVHRLGSFGVHHGESEQTGLKLMSSKFIKKVMYCLLWCQHRVSFEMMVNTMSYN